MAEHSGLILIAGGARSGTTWVAKIFDSHPDTMYRHEPDSVLRSELPLYVAPVDFERYAGEARAYVERMQFIRASKTSGKLPLFRKSYRSALAHAARYGLVLSAKVWERVWRAHLIPDLVRTADRPRVRPVWKSIESAGRLGLWVRALPEMRTLSIIRHACGAIASVLRLERAGGFAPSYSMSEDFGIFGKLVETEVARGHGLTLEYLRSLRPIERLAWTWVLGNEKALADTASAPNCLTFRYEDLCADPVGEARRLFEFAGLGWHPQTERFIADSTSRQAAGVNSVFKVPGRTAARWREELSPEDIRRILAIVSDTPPGRLFPE